MMLKANEERSNCCVKEHCYACKYGDKLEKILIDGYGRVPARNNISEKKLRCFCILHANLNKVVTKDELLDFIWPRGLVNSGSLIVLICELRSLLWHTDLKIETARGRGYILVNKGSRLVNHDE